MEEELHSVGKVHDLCRGYESIRIAESTVLDTVRTRSHLDQHGFGLVMVMSCWSCDDRIGWVVTEDT